MQGVLPLSTTLDSVGPLAMSVDCCEILYSIMSGRTIEPRPTDEKRPLRLFVPQSLASLDTDQAVAHDFERALMRLQADGVHVERGALSALDSVPALHANGGFSAYESWHWHAQRQGLDLSRYDPRVLSRIDSGRHITPEQYRELHRLRHQFIAEITQSLSGFDLFAMPTTPIVAPAISALEDEPAYTRCNRLMLRNPGVVNLFDGCSISLPMHRPGHAPTGFMLAGRNNDDQALLHHARRVERLLNQQDRASLAD
jgi:aspartyl-tRNA(Asn)/glutamyl-tRNA(Gln) amidotransferase subunit A